MLWLIFIDVGQGAPAGPRSPLACLHHEPLARCIKLRVRMRRECRERFPRRPRWAIPTCITARAWRTCRDGCRHRTLAVSFEVGDRGKRSRHSRRMRNLQLYVSGKRPIEACPCFVSVISIWLTSRIQSQLDKMGDSMMTAHSALFDVWQLLLLVPCSCSSSQEGSTYSPPGSSSPRCVTGPSPGVEAWWMRLPGLEKNVSSIPDSISWSPVTDVLASCLPVSIAWSESDSSSPWGYRRPLMETTTSLNEGRSLGLTSQHLIISA